MKYIRTKDAIYKVRKPALDEYLWEDSTYVYGHEHIKNSEIIKQADTIKELCDRFIVINGRKHIHYTKKDFDAKSHRYLCLDIKENKKQCYGAVWCEWGLKYVAKLNEKGELELL